MLAEMATRVASKKSDPITG